MLLTQRWICPQAAEPQLIMEFINLILHVYLYGWLDAYFWKEVVSLWELNMATRHWIFLKKTKKHVFGCQRTDDFEKHKLQLDLAAEDDLDLLSPWVVHFCHTFAIPIGSMYAIYGNMVPINIPQSC